MQERERDRGRRTEWERGNPSFQRPSGSASACNQQDRTQFAEAEVLLHVLTLQPHYAHAQLAQSEDSRAAVMADCPSPTPASRAASATNSCTRNWCTPSGAVRNDRKQRAVAGAFGSIAGHAKLTSCSQVCRPSNSLSFLRPSARPVICQFLYAGTPGHWLANHHVPSAGGRCQ